MKTWLVLSAALALFGCGGDDSVSTSDSGSDGPGPADSSGNPDTGGQNDSGSNNDSGAMDGGADAADTSTSGQTVSCDPSACPLPSQECCATPGSSGETYACIANGASCFGGMGGVATCDGPEDCNGDAGEVCCSKFTGGGLPNEACTAKSSCTGGMANVACHLLSDCPSGAKKCCDGTKFGFHGSDCYGGNTCP